MTGDQAPYLLYMVLLLVLIGSSLLSRRVPVGKTMKMAGVWVAIFAVGFALFSFRSEFMAVGSRLKAEAIGTPIQAGAELRIPMAEDGHFWVDASVNKHEERFLVDSGASVTTISRETANQAGVETGMRVALVETANGTVQMRKGRADSFSVGTIQRSDFAVQVNDHDDGNVLGMNFLSSLRSWRVEGRYLVLQP
jgi:aspartyl protease family protein